MRFLPSFIPILLVFISLGIAVSALKILKVYHGLKKRRSPFTAKFLRAPGQSLLEKIDGINDDLFAYMAMLIAMPILFYAIYISGLYFQKRPSLNLALVYFVIGGLFVGV